MIKQSNYDFIVPALRSLFLVTLFGFFVMSYASAQLADSTKDMQSHEALSQAISKYDQELSRNTMVYTGRGYFDPNVGVKGHQFLVDDYWELGSVTYNESLYDSIFLKYDMYQDVLLVENFGLGGLLSPIALYGPKVSSFELMGFRFVRLDKDTISNLKEGFYNIVYTGDDIRAIVKRRKEVIKSNEVNMLGEEFVEKDKYYIFKDDYYHQVKRKKSVLKVLYDRKKEVKEFIKSRGFGFKVNPADQLAEVVKYYDSLQ